MSADGITFVGISRYRDYYCRHREYPDCSHFATKYVCVNELRTASALLPELPHGSCARAFNLRAAVSQFSSNHLAVFLQASDDVRVL